MSWPSKSGQSGKMSAAQPAAPRSTPGHVVSAPKRSRAYTESAAKPTRSGTRTAVACLGSAAAKRERTSTKMKVASRIMAVARCASTVSAELFWSTVSLPSQAWKPTMARATNEPTTTDRVARSVRRAETTRPRTRKPTMTPHQRWIDSSQAAVSPSAGMTCPLQSGQSGQPMPDPVLRTTTPMRTIT